MRGVCSEGGQADRGRRTWAREQAGRVGQKRGKERRVCRKADTLKYTASAYAYPADSRWLFGRPAGISPKPGNPFSARPGAHHQAYVPTLTQPVAAPRLRVPSEPAPVERTPFNPHQPSPVPPHRPPHAPTPPPSRPSISRHRQRRLRRQQEVQPQADGQQVPSIERSRRCQCAECISKS